MKLILFCDYGLDDAAATVDALSHAREDGFDSVDLVAIGGNVPSEVALINVKKLLFHCTFAYPKVTVVSTVDEEQRSEYLKTIHGGDGMGDLFEEGEAGCAVIPYRKWLNELSGEYVLLSLGPMTLVGEVLARGNCKKFIFMGGNIQEEPNFHGYEFNHALNRKAFSEAAARPHVAVTMDTCRNALFNLQDAPLKGDTLLHRIVNRSREMTFVSGEKGCYIWDDIAVKCMRHPDWFCYEERVDKDGNRLTVARYVLKKNYREIIML